MQARAEGTRNILTNATRRSAATRLRCLCGGAKMHVASVVALEGGRAGVFTK